MMTSYVTGSGNAYNPLQNVPPLAPQDASERFRLLPPAYLAECELGLDPGMEYLVHLLTLVNEETD